MQDCTRMHGQQNIKFIFMMFVPRLISSCVCVYEFSMTKISCVTCVYICKRNSSDVCVFFFFLISDMSTQERCLELFTTQQSMAVFSHYSGCSSNDDIVSTGYMCFVCLYYVFHRLLQLCVWIFSFCHLLNVISYTTSLSVCS